MNAMTVQPLCTPDLIIKTDACLNASANANPASPRA
jgi:hypothetical protein